MNAKLGTAFAVTLIAVSQQASAQSAPSREEGPSYLEQHVKVPVKALELTVGTGYTQGFGMLHKDVNMIDVATPGVGIDLGIGYRIDPHWSVAVTGLYQALNAERSSSVSAFTPGIAAAYHFSPYTRLDPWLQIGTGYRILWENYADTSQNLVTHGFELGRATLGVDVRVHQDIAIAPVIGADINLPLWQSGAIGQTAIADPRVNTFVFAGLQGRFDVTDRHVPKDVVAQAPVSQTQITSAPVPQPPPSAPVEETKMISPSIAVSEELLAACHMNLDAIDKAPKFEFDKSELLPADYEVLNKIAECFTTGPLKDQNVRLVGRADPRGTIKYNDALGMRRANRVGSYLERLGVDSVRMDQISRGKRDATGHDEPTYQIDRRVDITLAH